jgi:hypothetical protein
MTVTIRARNTLLAALLAESGWTNGQFAAAVNRAGAEAGLLLSYDDSAVCHWLSGTVPRERARPLLCEVLTRRLRRPVTLAAAGLGTQPACADAQTGTVTRLTDLGSADMDPTRRAALGAIGLYTAALAIPGWADIRGRFDLLRTNPHVRAGDAEVEAVRTVTDHLSSLDDQFGGRAIRPLAASFLVNAIAPYLNADAPSAVRTRMLSAAADHCYLTGYMAMDERADGLAQQYYLLALRLAGHADDHLTYCTTLRGMSVQAVDLHHTSDALHLADAAAAAAPHAGPRMLAFLTGQQAHAAAQAGDRSQALARLRDAETAMDQAESQAQTFGSYDPAALHYHIAQVRYELGDRQASIDALGRAGRLRGPAYRRTRVRHLGTLAERKLGLGHLEDACADWNAMLDDYPAVQSGRCDDRYTAMMSLIRPYLRNPRARDLYQRARTLRPATLRVRLTPG